MTDVIFCVLEVVCILLIWVMLYDSNRFVVRKAAFSDRRIRKPLRAAVIADLHNKRYGKGNERLLEEIRAQEPDLILIAGDVLTAKKGESFERALEFLRELARDYPIYYGNGNHEHRLALYPKIYGDMGERYRQALEEIGIQPLVNSHAALEQWGVAVYGAQIHKAYYRRFKLAEMKADYLPGLLGKPREGLYTVLLAHHPDYFPQYAAWGADLTLSGHVHGGVARVPLLGRGMVSPGFRFFPKYDGGLFHRGEATMLVSRGLGSHTIPFRLFNPAELWVVDFSAGDGTNVSLEKRAKKR